jgi:dihydroorotase
VLPCVVPHTARQFARAIVMPNLRPPVTTVEQAQAYRERILAAVPQNLSFTPLMTLYLTDTTSPDEIPSAVDSGIVHGVKLYPAGATTHSDAAVTDVRRCYGALEAMQERPAPARARRGHGPRGGRVRPRSGVHRTDTGAAHEGLSRTSGWCSSTSPRADAVAFVREGDERLGATVTPQHILMNRNALFQGGIRPHHYCLPVLKRERHRRAIMEVLAEGHPRFFLGTDSAPHARGAKESACGCAGIYSAHAAIELYAEAFEQAGALEHLEAFASLNGARFYGLPVNEERITLVKEPGTCRRSIPWATRPSCRCGRANRSAGGWLIRRRSGLAARQSDPWMTRQDESRKGRTREGLMKRHGATRGCFERLLGVRRLYRPSLHPSRILAPHLYYPMRP